MSTSGGTPADGTVFTPHDIFGRPLDLSTLLSAPEHRRWADDILIHLGHAAPKKEDDSPDLRIPTLSTSSTTEPWEALDTVLAGVLEALLGDPGHRLAIYGSLAPDEVNHHVVASIPGQWTRGFVRGQLGRAGWAAEQGFPALTWEPGGERVDAWLLHAETLPDHWPRLDEFEGEEYRRALVPFEDDGGLLAVASVYVAATEPLDA